MSTLSDRTVKERLARCELTLKPFNPDFLQGNSYDVHLGGTRILRQRAAVNMAKSPPFVAEYAEYVIDPRYPDPDLWEAFPLPYLLRSLRFCLAVTREHITIPTDMEVELYGRSTVGRTGLNITNAGVLDAGWNGWTTLELFNITEHPILLTSSMDIGQFVFRMLTTDVDRPYGHNMSRYQNQEEEPVAPRPKQPPIQPSQQRVIDELAKVEWPVKG